MIPRHHIARAIMSTAIPEPNGELPDSIQWMPPGYQDVEPSVNGKPMRLKFKVQARHAALLNEQLQDMWAAARAGEGDEPYIDFNHDDKERSAAGTEFYWAGEDLKTGGIRLRVNWSGAGKKAVLGKDYRRFSPQWDFDPVTHEPLYVSANLGGLVNRAAFRNIAPIIAKEGDSAATTNTENNMELKDIEAALDKRFQPLEKRLEALEKPATTATARAATEDADLAETIGKAVAAGMKPLVDRFEKADQDTKKASAKAAVEVHIKRGAIGAQDADAISFWETSHIANAKNAESQMAKLPGKASARLTPGARTEDGNGAGDEPQDTIVAQARELVIKSNGRLTLGEALAQTARANEEGYRNFRSTFVAVTPKTTNKN